MTRKETYLEISSDNFPLQFDSVALRILLGLSVLILTIFERSKGKSSTFSLPQWIYNLKLTLTRKLEQLYFIPAQEDHPLWPCHGIFQPLFLVDDRHLV